MNSISSSELARRIRRHSLHMVYRANASHIGSALSIADILAVLYSGFLRVEPDNPAHPARDRFLLSKGHAAVALYAVLAERGFFPLEWLENYGKNGSPLLGHCSHLVPGVELSTGSLGHGLSVGCGLALAARADYPETRTWVVMGDGELNEGSIWEAVAFAAHHRLAQLLAIVDVNGQQGFGATTDILNMEPIAEKWRAFNWEVREVDGHDHAALRDSFTPTGNHQPLVVLARTVKGKGVSFMENSLTWHYKSPTAEQLTLALSELESA